MSMVYKGKNDCRFDCLIKFRVTRFLKQDVFLIDLRFDNSDNNKDPIQKSQVITW